MAAVAVALLLFLAGMVSGWYLNQNQRVSRARLGQLQTSLQQAGQETSALQRQVIALQSSEQVARNANRELRETIRSLQDRLAKLHGDLSVYQSLAHAGASAEGLTVHDFTLLPTKSSRVFDYRLSLVQNLQRAESVRGRVEFWVQGSQDGETKRLGPEALGLPGGEVSGYGFKYFQLIKGVLTLPDGVIPRRVSVRLVPENNENETVEADFQWSDVVQRESD